MNMSDWPPKPNASSSSSSETQPRPPAGKEWEVIQNTLLANVEEQRRSRRWSLVFKGLTFLYLGVVLILLVKSCTSSGSESSMMGGIGDDHIAVVEVYGAIAADSDASAERVGKALQEAFDSSSAKAVVIKINSPGGSPVQSDEIWKQIRNYQEQAGAKKVYAVIEDIGASGAYYVASAADEIYVNPSSLVGSIGVIMPNYDLRGLADKLGVKDRTLTAGDNKNLLSFTAPLSDKDKAHVMSVLDNVHAHFINAVQTGRGDKLVDPVGNELFSGLFWSGDQAILLGLADQPGGLSDIKKDLGIDTAINYLPADPLQELFSGLGLSFQQQLAGAMAHELSSKLSDTDQPQLN